MSNTLIKLKATADILGGAVFFATDAGIDPEYPNNGDLLPNGMYIRLEGSDGSIAYISAYELDKALGIIGEMSMSKANAADVLTIQAALEDKVSNITFELLQGEVADKASKNDVDNISDALATKADQSVVDNIIEQLNAKANQELLDSIMSQVETKANATDVEALTTTVSSKANASDVEEMLADIAALQETVQLLTNSDSIAAINNQIAYLNSEIQRRLTIDDLQSLNSTVSELTSSNNSLSERVDNVEVNLNKKATTTYVQGQVTELNTAITGLAALVEAKANKTEISNKANKTDVDNIVKRVNTIGTSVSNLEISVDDNYKELFASVQKKANKTDVDIAIEDVTNALTNKSNRSDVNLEFSRLNTRINDLQELHSSATGNIVENVANIETSVNNSLAEMRASLNTQSRTVTSHTSQISKLESTTSTQTDKLKQNWIRVLTSNEYKKLTTPPDGVPYNNRYKYPNTLYLVVDYNKPKAIYIGDILVAQAEQKGSIGFAYTFPIVF